MISDFKYLIQESKNIKIQDQVHYESDKKNESDQCYCVFGHRVRILFSRFYMAESKYKIKVTDKFYELSLVDLCAIRNNPNLLVLFKTGESDLVIRYFI